MTTESANEIIHRLTEGGLRSRVAERLAGPVRLFLIDLLCLFVEEKFHDGSSVVHRNHVDDRFRKALFLGDALAILDVSDDHQSGHLRRQPVVDVVPALHILDEVTGFVHLADVVIKRPDPAQKAIRTDGVGRFLCELADHQ